MNTLENSGGEEGIRTLDTGFGPYNGLANRRLQPLGHLTANAKCTRNQDLRKAPPAQAAVFQSATLRIWPEKLPSMAESPCGTTAPRSAETATDSRRSHR